ncbi:hypothetical protein SAMN02745975_02700 [Geosporobacter subterraneus DSM 17957]|uniref:Pectate lyase C n=1 Tax=Geosporobacter subterraneus DSM 17957 TaxID=1121919 RepID=A0A1M6LK49_9FIRM|nr:hypothetical protein [Geosporobacter subterraneus]SHJ71571.1 hypothetical protein SAMN02745975_02700 [Geosporobacter subterraneus DSM 17957]
MRRYLAVLLLVGCFFIIEGYSQEETTVQQSAYDEVYYSTKSGDNYFDDIRVALDKVASGGTVYIEKQLDLTKRLVIEKPVHIKFLSPEYIKAPQNISIFYLSPSRKIQSFSVEGMQLKGVGITGIDGWAEKIAVKNSNFENCIPIKMNDVWGDYRADFINCTFINSDLSVNPSKCTLELGLYDSHFSASTQNPKYILLKNNTLYAEGNTFHRMTILVELNGTAVGAFSKNTFTGNDGRITISGNAKGLLFRKNNFLKVMTPMIKNGTGDTLDFKENWWGNRKGPKPGTMEGKVDSSRWALFDNFSRFAEDPYTLEDLREACARIEDVWKGDSWLYDLDENEEIDLLDVFMILRMIR